MRTTAKWCLVTLVLLVLAFVLGVKAQNKLGYFTVSANLPVAATASLSECSPPVKGVTNWCKTGAVEAVSVNGGAYVQVWPAK